MIMYNGGMVVAKGLYWSPIDGWRVDMRDSGVLPGNRSSSYLKISPMLLLAISPFLGMTFLFFLPLFGIGVLIIICLSPAITALSAITTTALRVCSGKSENRAVADSRPRLLIGEYKPSGASFTGAAKRKKAACKPK